METQGGKIIDSLQWFHDGVIKMAQRAGRFSLDDNPSSKQHFQLLYRIGWWRHIPGVLWQI
jgi:hypothetical protein